MYKYSMRKNPIIPDTWGIPDDQANKVREALSKKSIRREDAVQTAIEELARDRDSRLYPQELDSGAGHPDGGPGAGG